jgi:type I restriction enzyme, S subunit
MEFTKRNLGDICDEVKGIIQTGPFGSQLHKSDYKDEGIPVVMPKNIIEGKISIEDIARIGKEDIERLSQHKLQKGDIVYGRRGDIGRRALVKEEQTGWLCGTGCIKISLRNSGILESSFLYYYLGQPEIVSWIYNQAIGATMPNLNTSIIRSIQITYPSLAVQRKVASILSNYDDLIENNTRRIEILEQMAKMVYEEWFIKFRFPGHEKVKMVPSELGEIPEGWKVKKFREILSHYIGGGWGNEQKQEKFTIGSYVIRGTDIPHLRNGVLDIVPYRFHKDSNLKSRKIEPFDIIMEVSGGSKDQPVGRSILITEEMLQNFNDNVMCASFCKLLRLSSFINPYYVDQTLQLLYDTGEIIKYQTQSTGISNFKFEFFIDDFEILIPPIKVLNKFHSLLDLIYKEIDLLGSRNQNLRKTRDLLLPKLISGEIDVSDLDIRIKNEYQESNFNFGEPQDEKGLRVKMV